MFAIASALTLLTQSGQMPLDPQPLTPASTWLSSADYPKELQAIRGRTVVVLAVSPQGQVAGCEIKSSSGSSVLDETVCRRARVQARFAPARNSKGIAINGTFVLPVLWGRPDIDIKPTSARLVATLKNGQMVSCIRYDSAAVATDITHAGCSISTDLLRRYFGQNFVVASQLTIDTVTIPGMGAVPRAPVDGRRVVVKEAVVTIGEDGRVQSCVSRVPDEAEKASLDDCVGFPTNRKFTGLRLYVSAIDWTLK